MSTRPTFVLERVDAVLDEIDRARAALITEPPSVYRCSQLAELADNEAVCWAAVFEHTTVRTHWRAALVAREHALHTARYWRHQATNQQTSEPSVRRVGEPVSVGVD